MSNVLSFPTIPGPAQIMPTPSFSFTTPSSAANAVSASAWNSEHIPCRSHVWQGGPGLFP